MSGNARKQEAHNTVQGRRVTHQGNRHKGGNSLRELGWVLFGRKQERDSTTQIKLGTFQYIIPGEETEGKEQINDKSAVNKRG